MNLNNLTKIKNRTKKRVGQGHGSGRVKTAGRGQKGAKVRGKIPLSFDGADMNFIKRLPFLKGKGRNFEKAAKEEIIHISKLAIFKDGDLIDIKMLIDKKLVDSKKALKNGVKILGNSPLDKKLSIKLPLSKGAKNSIEKAGGKVVNE